MKVYRGLLQQKGQGVLGTLLKFGVPVVGVLVEELVGGIT